MSRQYLNDRWCVRCGRSEPTPYLRKHISYLENCRLVADFGCGNGRNTTYLNQQGIPCIGFDSVCRSGIQITLGVDSLPFCDGIFDGILMNYLLMFLNKNERSNLYNEINRCSAANCTIVVELYPAMDSETPNYADMHDLMNEIVDALSGMGFEQEHRVESKNADRGIFVRRRHTEV